MGSLPYSSNPPPFVIPDCDEGRRYAVREVQGEVPFRYCHDFRADKHPFLTDDDLMRPVEIPACSNRTRAGVRTANWCLRCPAGFIGVYLSDRDSASDRDSLSV